MPPKVLCTGYRQRFPFLFGEGKVGGATMAEDNQLNNQAIIPTN